MGEGVKEGKGCRWQKGGKKERERGEYHEGNKGLREGELEGLREGMRKRSPSSSLYGACCALWAFPSLVQSFLYLRRASTTYCFHQAQGPKRGSQWWAMILPGVGGGNIFPLWLSLPCSCLLRLDKPSNSVCLLSLGRTMIGSAAKDITLQGPGLAPEHCYIENLRGTLTLYPCGNACTIDGLPVQQPTRLTQGKV